MSCSSCKYLNANNKKEGAVSGSCYYCSKVGSYVNGSNDRCQSFDKSYRSNYECNKIYEDGERYYDDTTSIGGYLFILIILIIIAIIVNV